MRQGTDNTTHQPLLDAHELTVSVGSHVILDELSLSLRAGELVLLTGANGSGKSTLLKTLWSHAQSSRSQQNLADALPHARVRGHIEYAEGASVALCPDSHVSLPDLSGWDNLYLRALCAGLSEADARDRSTQLTGLVPDYRPHVRSDEYSRGMRRRLDILLTVIESHAIYCFDEPFHGLDAEWVQMALAIFGLLRHSGASVLVASHHHPYLVQHADRLLKLEGSRLTEIGESAPADAEMARCDEQAGAGLTWL